MRTLTGKEVAKYYKEFPFLKNIVDIQSARNTKRFKLKVQVQVADAASLYIIPEFCLPPHLTCTRDDKYLGHVYPSAYAFNEKNQPVRIIHWDYQHTDNFLKDVIKGVGITYVVLVMKYHWWVQDNDWIQKNLESPIGEYSHHEYHILVLKQPHQGFGTLVIESDLTKNVPIKNFSSINMAGHNGQPEAAAAIKELKDLVHKLEKEIGVSLWKTVNSLNGDPTSGIFGKTELRTFLTGGRIVFSFWSGTYQFTVVGDDTDVTRTGLQSMNCSVDQAKFMIQEVIDNWNSALLHRDNNISFPF